MVKGLEGLDAKIQTGDRDALVDTVNGLAQIQRLRWCHWPNNIGIYIQAELIPGIGSVPKTIYRGTEICCAETDRAQRLGAGREGARNV